MFMSKGKWIGIGIIILVAIVAAIVAMTFIVCEVATPYIESEVEQRIALLDCELTPVYFYPIGWGPPMFPPDPPGPSYVDLFIRLSIYNPNDYVTATLDRMDYTIYANEIAIGSGCFSGRTDIPPGGARMVSTTYRADLRTAPAMIISAIVSGDITWKVGGTAYIDTPFGTLITPFEISINQFLSVR